MSSEELRTRELVREAQFNEEGLTHFELVELLDIKRELRRRIELTLWTDEELEEKLEEASKNMSKPTAIHIRIYTDLLKERQKRKIYS